MRRNMRLGASQGPRIKEVVEHNKIDIAYHLLGIINDKEISRLKDKYFDELEAIKEDRPINIANLIKQKGLFK